jgi:hypothetical protein
MKVPSAVSVLLHADGQVDSCDSANRRTLCDFSLRSQKLLALRSVEYATLGGRATFLWDVTTSFLLEVYRRSFAACTSILRM